MLCSPAALLRIASIDPFCFPEKAQASVRMEQGSPKGMAHLSLRVRGAPPQSLLGRPEWLGTSPVAISASIGALETVEGSQISAAAAARSEGSNTLNVKAIGSTLRTGLGFNSGSV